MLGPYLRLATGVLLLAGFSSPPGLPAQTPLPRPGGSLLWLPAATGPLEIGAVTRGSLSSADYRTPRDAYLDIWEIEGRAGQSVTLDLRAEGFDAVLYVVGPGLDETLWDDDSGGGCDARVTLTFLENGTFRVIATSSAQRESGVYTLLATTSPEPVDERPCGEAGPDLSLLVDLPTQDRRLRLGGRVSGALSATDRTLADGSHVQAWALDGRAGQVVTITLESDDFDAYLYLVGPGIASPLSDDDSGGELHARLTVTFPETGTYLVVVSSALGDATGAFRLSVRAP